MRLRPSPSYGNWLVYWLFRRCCIVLVIGLVSSILAVVIICTVTVVVLLCRTRWGHKGDSNYSAEHSSSWSSTSDFSLPRIPRAQVGLQSGNRQTPQPNLHVWRKNNPGIVLHVLKPNTHRRRNCRVESRRRCIRNLQLVGDSLDESEQICQQRVELRCVDGVNTLVGSRRELVANCVHTADADATQLDSCVASAVRIGHKTTYL